MEMVPPSSDEANPGDSSTTIYKSDTGTSFTIPLTLAFRLDKMQRKDLKIALYELGSSRFNISILEYNDGVFSVLTSFTDEHLGGDNFDKAIVDWLANEFNKDNPGHNLKKDYTALHRLYEAAERAKIELSDVECVKITLPYITSVNSVPKNLFKSLSRKEFEDLCDASFLRSISLCAKAIEASHISISDIDIVWLAGASTRIPKIQELVKCFFGKEPDKELIPFESKSISNSINGEPDDIESIAPTPPYNDVIAIQSMPKSTIVSASPSRQDIMMATAPPCSQEKLQAIKSSVWPKLSSWVRYKKYHSGDPTYDSLARVIGVKKTDLQEYFKYVEPIGLHHWIDRLRIEDAENDLAFFTDEHFTYLPFKLGFDNPRDFEEAFVRFVGESPQVWRMKMVKKIEEGDAPIYPKFKKAIDKVSAAFTQWVEEKKYRASGLTQYSIARELHVSETALYLYCDWVLKKRIWDKVNDYRIDDAKQLVLNDPSLEWPTVAKMVGYSTQGTLTRYFKMRMGESPLEWRKRMFPGYKRVSTPHSLSVPMSTTINKDQFDQWIRRKRFCKPFLSAKNVAFELGCEEKSLVQYLLQQENSTFNEWLSKLRLKEARHTLLIKPYLSNEQIGRFVGFPSRAVFGLWLKNNTSCSPQEWRAAVLEKKDGNSLQSRWGSNLVSNQVVSKIEAWVESKGYCTSSYRTLGTDLDIKDKQLSIYCGNEGYMVSMWVDRLRIWEAQRLLIADPSMMIVDIQDKVGDTERSPFREMFKRMVGLTPTEWRSLCDGDDQLMAEVHATETIKPTTPFALDVEKVKVIESTTTQAQGILSDIFKEEEPEDHQKVNQKAEDAVLAVISLIFAKEKWSRAEFNYLCSSHSLLPGYAVERINDIAYERIGDALIDEDEASLYINTDYKDMLI